MGKDYSYKEGESLSITRDRQPRLWSTIGQLLILVVKRKPIPNSLCLQLGTVPCYAIWSRFEIPFLAATFLLSQPDWNLVHFRYLSFIDPAYTYFLLLLGFFLLVEAFKKLSRTQESANKLPRWTSFKLGNRVKNFRRDCSPLESLRTNFLRSLSVESGQLQMLVIRSSDKSSRAYLIRLPILVVGGIPFHFRCSSYD